MLVTNNERHDNQNWYVRQALAVHGPYTVGHVKREILIGHITADNEISHDKDNWTKIGDHPELIPTVMKADLTDPLARDRLDAARRWADDGHDSHNTLSEQLNYDLDDDDDHQQGSIIALKLQQNRRKQWLNTLIFLFLVLIIVVALYQYFSKTVPVLDTPIDCSATPVEAIDLSNCFLQGQHFSMLSMAHAQLKNTNLSNAELVETNLTYVDLSYSLLNQANLTSADLHDSILIGVDFSGANLTNANLSNTDLSYANLLSAKINGANLTGARLDHARWIDGTICRKGAITNCQ